MISDAVTFRALIDRTEGPQAMRQIVALGLAGLITFAALGCASTRDRASELPDVAAAPVGPSAVRADQLVPIDTDNRGVFLLRPDHQLGRYDELLIEHVGFRYSQDQKWLSYREEDRISAILAGAVAGKQDGAIGIAEEPGPCVLGVRFFVTDLELYDSGYGVGSYSSFVRSFGEATMIMELRDSMSEETLARFVQRRELGGGRADVGSSTSIRRLASVVSDAMRDMGDQITRITPPTANGWEGECEGAMTRVAFGSH